MAFAHNQGLSISFEDIGTGRPVVLGHSFLCSGKMWREQVPALAETHRVLNLDFRGHGGSSEVTQSFSLYDAVSDVVAVLDALGIEKAVWCGLSVGGMVALRAALSVPSLILVGEEDRSLPASLSRQIHDLLPDSELVQIPAAGHLSALERPVSVNEAVLDFLKRRLS